MQPVPIALYCTLVEQTVDELDYAVAKEIEAGCQPYGDMKIVIDDERGGFYQTMVKYKSYE